MALSEASTELKNSLFRCEFKVLNHNPPSRGDFLAGGGEGGEYVQQPPKPTNQPKKAEI